MMGFSNFIYRQKQKFKYHTATDNLVRRIAEINRFEEHIIIKNGNFRIKSLNLDIPVRGFDFAFNEGSFELLLTIANRLDGKYSFDQGRLIFAFADIQIIITSGSELFIINEIFVNRCYDFKLPSSSSVMVIDMGMNVGLASLYFATNTQVERIFSFEPFLPTVKMAENNFSLNPNLSKKIKIHNYGLGDSYQNITVKYDVSNSGLNGTLMLKSNLHGQVDEALEIRPAGVEVNKIILDNPGKEVVIKIDTEGAEYPIFDSLFSSGLPKSIVGFFIEWHIKGPKTLESKLLNEGFKLVSFNLTNDVGLIYAFR